jgi:GNAT superfamily N-acetyltransferase
MITPHLSYRQDVRESDRDAIREIVASSGFFSAEEIDIAVELLDERLVQGEKSGYYFLFAEQEGHVVGYTCFGPIPGTLHSYDLYWIALHERFRGRGIGKHLLGKSEDLIAIAGGKRIYIETSSRPQYEMTLTFYKHCRYEKVAYLEDFYAPGDGKIILVKTLP